MNRQIFSIIHDTISSSKPTASRSKAIYYLFPNIKKELASNAELKVAVLIGINKLITISEKCIIV